MATYTDTLWQAIIVTILFIKPPHLLSVLYVNIANATWKCRKSGYGVHKSLIAQESSQFQLSAGREGASYCLWCCLTPFKVLGALQPSPPLPPLEIPGEEPLFPPTVTGYVDIINHEWTKGCPPKRLSLSCYVDTFVMIEGPE